MIYRLVLFVLMLAGAMWWVTWDLQHTQLQALWNEALAFLTEKTIQLFKGSVSRVGNQLTDPFSHHSIMVLGGCNGFEVTATLVAAILVYPSCFNAKLLGVIAGFLAVQSLNVVRLVCLYYLNIWDEEVFRFAHLYVWQSLIMLDVLIVLVIWLRWQRKLCKST